MFKGRRPPPMALSDESSQESPGFPTQDLQKAALQPRAAEPAVHVVVESGVEDEQLAEGSLGFRTNRSQASAKLSTRRWLHDSDNPTESWAVHSID